MKSLFLSLLLISTVQATAQQVTPALKAKLSQELNYIAGIFESEYAPKQWKERHLNWNLQAELAKAQSLLQNAQTAQQYREAAVSLIRSTADYHVGYSFVATELAFLPFQVRTYEGKSLIVYIDRAKLPLLSFPFNEGDELVSLDGVSVAEVKKTILQSMGSNVATTDEALADLSLTRRRASRNLVVPKGPVLLQIKKTSGQVVSHQLIWEYTPEIVKGRTHLPVSEIEKNQTFKLKSPIMTSAMAKDFMMAGNPHSVGEKKSFLPDFGVRLWEAAEASEFDAYIYKNADSKLIGVIRIPSYTPTDATKAVRDFATIIKKLESTTDGLIIDQVNNPGGSVFYLYALASMLTKDSLSTPRHRMMLSASEILEAHTTLKSLESVKTDEDAQRALGPNLAGYPSSYQIVVNLRECARFLIEQWEAGKKMTDPYYVWGVDRINPSTTANYTKPIVLLVNELDFSGGDFFPAILQDNRRVTVVGTRTAGAGGYVRQTEFMNSFGLASINYTASIAERVDSNPIENLGVKPDVLLPFTADDVRNGYRVYLREVQATLKKLMN